MSYSFWGSYPVLSLFWDLPPPTLLWASSGVVNSSLSPPPSPGWNMLCSVGWLYGIPENHLPSRPPSGGRLVILYPQLPWSRWTPCQQSWGNFISQKEVVFCHKRSRKCPSPASSDASEPELGSAIANSSPADPIDAS